MEPIDVKLGYEEDEIGLLANMLYEHGVSAETLARNYGKAGALSFFGLMGKDIQNFWRGIAKQLLEHSKEWESNEGSTCVLGEKEVKRLQQLFRV